MVSIDQKRSLEANFKWELLNPKTGLGYFDNVSSETDLRYLSAIYPEAPLALILEADSEQFAGTLCVESGQVILYKP